MRRVLFTWCGIAIPSYPALLYVGMTLGLIAGRAAAMRAGLDGTRVFALMLGLTIPGLVGARLLYVASHWSHYRREPRRIWRRAEGGASCLGGLPPMVAASVPLTALLEVPFAAFWDAAAFPLLIGMACARVGCFLNGCCCGRETDGRLGLCLPNVRGVWRRRVPTQLLELALALVVLALVALAWERRPFPGAIALFTIATYSFGRVFLEGLRASQDRLGSVRLHRGLSAGFGALAVAGLALGWLHAGL